MLRSNIFKGILDGGDNFAFIHSVPSKNQFPRKYLPITRDEAGSPAIWPVFYFGLPTWWHSMKKSVACPSNISYCSFCCLRARLAISANSYFPGEMFPFGISASSYIFYWGDCLLWISVTSYFNWARLLSDHCQCLLCQGACSLWDQCQYFLCRELVPFCDQCQYLLCRKFVPFGTSAISWLPGACPLWDQCHLLLCWEPIPFEISANTYFGGELCPLS
jgi:hypothetical protein